MQRDSRGFPYPHPHPHPQSPLSGSGIEMKAEQQLGVQNHKTNLTGCLPNAFAFSTAAHRSAPHPPPRATAEYAERRRGGGGVAAAPAVPLAQGAPGPDPPPESGSVGDAPTCLRGVRFGRRGV